MSSRDANTPLLYNQTRKTRNISGMLLCSRKKQIRHEKLNHKQELSLFFCVASLYVLIFALIGYNTINIPEMFQVFMGFACLIVIYAKCITWFSTVNEEIYFARIRTTGYKNVLLVTQVTVGTVNCMQYSGQIEAQSKNKIHTQTSSTDIKLKAFWSTEKDASKGRKSLKIC